MKKIIGVVLVLLAVYLGYMGITTFSESTESIKLLGIEITAQDSDTKSTAFIFIAFSVISLLGGLFLLKTK